MYELINTTIIVLAIPFAILLLGAVVYLCMKPMVRRSYGKWPLLGGVALTAIMLSYGFGNLTKTRGDKAFDVDVFAETPVQFEGRLMPIDTVARNTLRVIRGRETVELAAPSEAGYKESQETEKISAIEWLLMIMASPEEADELNIFRIDHPAVFGLFGWPRTDQKYYSFADLQPHLGDLMNELRNLPEADQRESRHEAYIKLANALQAYDRLIMSFHSGAGVETLGSLYRNWEVNLKRAAQEARKQQLGQTADTELLNFVSRLFQLFQRMEAKSGTIAVVPSEMVKAEGPEWLSMAEAMLLPVQGKSVPPVAINYAELIEAYRGGNAEQFNREVTEINQAVQGYAPISRIAFEEFFHLFEPFVIGSALYVLAMIVTFVGWLKWEEPLRQTAFWIILFTFILHTFGLIARMYIMDRPAPVTNLYSSAVFVGWAAVGLGLLLEHLFKTSFGNLVCALVGFSTLAVAHGLDDAGGTMEVMRAVLDSNFWLTTHVVIITLGYSAMFVAGILAIAWIVCGLLTPNFKADVAKVVSQMVYGILAFALLLSFVGTMLGGIWADQSWGRFWGWDPKENGALMIVLWVALILHARWGGMIKARGLMVLTVGGNMITAWSWFGTNQLGIGLHSYGFTDSGAMWLLAFWTSQLFIIAIGLTPARFWMSARQLFPTRLPAREVAPVPA